MVGFGVESRWLVAGCEFGCGDGTALGVDLAHGVSGQVAAVGGLAACQVGGVFGASSAAQRRSSASVAASGARGSVKEGRTP